MMRAGRDKPGMTPLVQVAVGAKQPEIAAIIKQAQ